MNHQSQLCRCFSLENGAIVQDIGTAQFLEDAPDSNFTESFEHAFIFPDFDAALKAGRQYCGKGGFKVICFGAAVQTKPKDDVVDNVIFG